MTVCHTLECINNNRLTPPRCKLTGEAELGEEALCIHFEVDFVYLRVQGRERDKQRPWLKPNAGKIHNRKTRVLICGDRDWTDEETIEKYIETLAPRSMVIHGAYRGADLIAGRLADKHGHLVIPFRGKWGKYGRAAGSIRNTEMLDRGDPDLVIAFHDDIEESKGTKDMIEQASERGIPYKIIPSKEMIAGRIQLV